MEGFFSHFLCNSFCLSKINIISKNNHGIFYLLSIVMRRQWLYNLADVKFCFKRRDYESTDG